MPSKNPNIIHNLFKGPSTSALNSAMRKKTAERKIKTMDIEIYEKMALYQTKLALKKLLKEIKIQDYLIMHRYGNLKPGENIIFLIVASEHRKEGFVFIQEILLYFKKKITFWKKENYQDSSKWLDKQS